MTTRWHRLKTSAERYVILSGYSEVEVDDLPPKEVQPGDVVLIPAMRPQRIKNADEEDLVFLALCTPRFRPEDYEEL